MTCEISDGMFQIKELEVEKHQEMATETNIHSVERNGGGK